MTNDEIKNEELDETTPLHKKKRIFIPIILIIAGIITGVYYYLHAMNYVSTDDAFVEAHQIQVSPKISGNVIKVYIDDNQKVKKGDVLAEIEPVDYKVKQEQTSSAVDVAKAQKEAAENQIAQSEKLLEQINADILAAKSDLTFAEGNFGRYTKLYNLKTASRQDYDKAQNSYESAQSKLQSLNKKAAAANEQIAVSTSQSKAASAQIKQLQANDKQAKLNLSYTKIYAPVAGTVAVKSVEEGVYIQTGQPLCAIVSPERWIVANFKETQIAKMKIGQPVGIKIDTYPNKIFKGKVDSFQSATGASTSLFPPENAVGSYVKVVQRIPVKIIFTEEITENYNIFPGMSAIPEVKIK